MPKPNDYKMKKKKITEFQKQLGNEEVDHFEKNMFDESFQGGQTEADALIERYSKKTKLSDEEKEILTDACKIFAMKGEKVYLVDGEVSNMKITYPFDLKVAATMLGGDLTND